MNQDLEKEIRTILDAVMLLKPITVRFVFNKNIGTDKEQELILWYQGDTGSAYEEIDSAFYGIMQTQKMIKIPHVSNSTLLQGLPLEESGAVFFPVQTEYGYCGFLWACFESELFTDQTISRFSGFCDWLSLSIRNELQKEFLLESISNQYIELLDAMKYAALIVFTPDNLVVSNPCFESLKGRGEILNHLHTAFKDEYEFEAFTSKYKCLVRELDYCEGKVGKLIIFPKEETTRNSRTLEPYELHYYRLLTQKARGNLSMLDSTDVLSDVQKNYVDRIEQSLKRLESLYSSCDSYYEKAHQEQQSGMELVSIQDIVKEVMLDLASAARNKHIEIEQSIRFEEEKRSAGKALGSHWMLTLAVFNLLDNAIRYSKTDGKPVQLEAVYGETEWSLIVRDFGIGIAPLDLEKIREAPLDDGVTELKGIHFVRYVAEVHHGTLDIESRLGKGSTFTLHIPYY